MAKKDVQIRNPKKGKPAILMGWVLVLGAAGLFFNADPFIAQYCFPMFGGGAILWLYGKIVHWWHWE